MTAINAFKHDASGRTTGKRKKRSGTGIVGQFIARPRAMMESPAFRVLTLTAHRVLARIEVEHCAHGGADNGALPVTYDDFQRYGIARECICPAIAMCEALGFVEVVERGRAGNAEFRAPNVFRLTYLPTPFMNPTNEWAKIEDLKAAKAIARAAMGKSRDAKRKEAGSKKQNSSTGF
jgi:hypothetical protein